MTEQVEDSIVVSASGSLELTGVVGGERRRKTEVVDQQLSQSIRASDSARLCTVSNVHLGCQQLQSDTACPPLV